MKKIVYMILIAAIGLVITSSSVRAQTNKTTAVARKSLPKSNQQDLGKTWMDQVDEQALIHFLGIDPSDVNPPAAMRIAVDDPGNTGGGGGGGGGGGTGPVGTGGALLAVSRIQSQNFKGIFQNVGTIDLPAFIDETWSTIESSVTQGIEDQLANTHRSLTGPDLQGFYNIQISLTGLSQASRAVYVWPDNRKARITLTLPDNVITCRANLNNWPDRDVGVRTNIHLDIDIKLTDTFSDPTQIVSSAVRFSGTEAWNDGILYEDTFNAELEADFNATYEDVPAALVDLLFTADNNLLASKTSASTRSIQFQYVAAEKRLNFKILNSIKVVSPLNTVGSASVKRTAQ
ncbi:MAG: hypothetical protein U0930_06915 [Pirellulales bacterium]